MAKIGIIGTGFLGNSVGEHLLEVGHELFIYNRTKSKTDSLKQKGATVCDFPKQVAKSSEIIIVVVKDANAVNQVSFESNGIVEGIDNDSIVADMSTINPLESKQITKKFRESNIEKIDIPVMGGPNVAVSGNLVMMVSGNKDIFHKYENILNTIASKVFYLGEVGTAHAIKLAMNLQIAMLALSLSEGITLARATKVQPETFLKILNSTYFKTGMSENKAFKMIRDEFSPTFTLKNLKKDLSTINHTAKISGIALPMSTKAEEVYLQAIENGFGELDYTGILAHIKQISKSDNRIK